MTVIRKQDFLSKYLPALVGFGLNTMGWVNKSYAAKLALEIFRTPRKGRLKPHQSDYLANFELRFLDSHGLKVATYFMDKNSSQTILFAHGWESNSSRWKRILKYIEDTPYNFALLDAPAHGQSGSSKFDGVLYSDMIRSAIEHYSPTVLVGHSIGAFSSAFALHRFGTFNISNLILLASPDTMTEITNTYFDIIRLNNRVRTSYMDNFEKWYSNPLSKFATSEFVQNIPLLGLIIHDKKDSINGYHNGLSIHKEWKTSTMYTTEGFDHGLQSKQVFQYLKDYLKQL